MKKLLCLLFAILILTSVVGCSTSQNQTSEQPNGQNATQEEQKIDSKELVNQNGEAFVPDLTASGKTSTKIPLNSNQIELCGKTYTLPIRVSDLIADGWEMNPENYEREFKAKSSPSLVNFPMKNKDGAYIDLVQAHNDTDSTQKLKDCLIKSFSIEFLENETNKIDFVLPGGIVKESTAADVVDIYGNPNDSEIFAKNSSNSEMQLSYFVHKDSGLSFTYRFEENGALNYARISANID